MELILATENSHKLAEFTQILEGHTVLMPADIGTAFEYEETGHTYLENALGKARHLHSLTGRTVIADDSGLSVPALGGAPGIYSARYGALSDGAKRTAAERNALLLENMTAVEDRDAFFVCCMVLVLDEYRFFVAQETVHGVITREPAGDGGFGYDPVFFIPEYGKTVAQLTPEVKNRISHRGRASAGMAAIIESLVHPGQDGALPV